MTEGTLIEAIQKVLRELGGYFVWEAADGEEYVMLSRQDFDQRVSKAEDTQLGLLSRVPASNDAPRWTADDMLDKINRDVALYQLQRAEEEEEQGDDAVEPLPPIQGKRVTFEPLRGDLPPELQE